MDTLYNTINDAIIDLVLEKGISKIICEYADNKKQLLHKELIKTCKEREVFLIYYLALWSERHLTESFTEPLFEDGESDVLIAINRSTDTITVLENKIDLNYEF